MIEIAHAVAIVTFPRRRIPTVPVGSDTYGITVLQYAGFSPAQASFYKDDAS